MNILPSPELQFFTSNGIPAAGGSVATYVPNSFTPVATYKDIAGSQVNTNPIILDSQGRCLAWMTGSVRMVVEDANSNQIMDQNTSSALSESLVSTAMLPVLAATTLASARTAMGIDTEIATALDDSGFVVTDSNGVLNGLTVYNDVALLGAGTALAVPNGLILGNILQSSGSETSSVGGWSYNSSGPSAESGSVGFAIIAGGSNMLAVSFFAVSDERVKSEIQLLTREQAEDFIAKARPVTYIKNGFPEAGFLAQDQIKAGYGQYVGAFKHEGLAETTDADGLTSNADVELNLNYSNYTAYLTAALKATMDRVAALETIVFGKPQ